MLELKPVIIFYQSETGFRESRRPRKRASAGTKTGDHGARDRKLAVKTKVEF